MGSTVTEDAPAGAPDKDKAGKVKQAASRKPAAKKKTAGKKSGSRNSQAAGDSTAKPRGKPASGGGSTAKNSRKKAPVAGGKTAQSGPVAPPAETEADAALAPEDANPTGADPRSISWMSAQAVSALKAVKANQARKAESLLARVEKPVPGRPAITELPEQTSDDLLEELPEIEAPAVTPPPQASTPTPPDAAGGEPTITKEAIVMQDKPGEQEITATETETGMERPDVENAHAAPVEAPAGAAVIAANTRQRGLPVRPIVMTVFLALLAYSGYRYWQDNRDDFTVPPEAGSYRENVQGAGWDDIPQQEAIAVVGEKSGDPSVPAAGAPGFEDEVAAQDDATDGDVPVPGTAAAPAAWKPDVSTAPAVTDPVPVTAEQAGTETPETAELAATGPAQPAPAPAVTPPAQPAQPQSPYGAPGYGYYPQQPNWQQPYYRPGYPPQYPAR